VTNVAISISLSGGLYHSASPHTRQLSEPLLLAVVACVYFAANTFPVAAIIALTESKNFNKTWKSCYV
jgi:hypothetical protein